MSVRDGHICFRCSRDWVQGKKLGPRQHILVVISHGSLALARRTHSALGKEMVCFLPRQCLQQEADAAHAMVSQLEARIRQLQVENESKVM